MNRSTLAIASLAVAAGLAAMCFVFAHLDYRRREEYFIRLQSGEQPPPPDDKNLLMAFGFGVPAAMVGAVSIGLFVIEFRQRDRSSDESEI